MEKRLNSNLLKESFLSDFFKEKLNDFANTQTAGFQTQMVPYIEMQSLHMLKHPE